jgi:hypothetical protein
MSFKARVLLSLMALLLLVGSSVAAGTAYAEAGPFFSVRETGAGEGLGEGIPLAVRGEGGEQRLQGTIATEPIELSASKVQVKGALSNSQLQGQIKLEIIYTQPHVVKPVALAGTCVVKIGENNIVQLKGHLVWKYAGVAKELAEEGAAGQKPEIVLTPKEISHGATDLPGGTLTNIHFATTGCGLFPTVAPVEGNQVALLSPPGLEEWSTSLSARTKGGKEELVHFWNGEKNVEGKAGLKFDNNEASLIGQIQLNAGGGEEITVVAALPEYEISETELKFGQVNEKMTSPPMSFNIKNKGVQGKLGGGSLLGPFAFFGGNSCYMATLPHNADCVVEITFTSLSKGMPETGLYSVMVNPKKAFRVRLEGEGK